MTKPPRLNSRLVEVIILGIFILGVVAGEISLNTCKRTITSNLYREVGICGQLLRDNQSSQQLVFVPQSQLKANGRACGKVAFVAQELPYFAKKYVSLHELLHVSHPELSETQVNYQAAIRQPLGLIQTIFHSLFANLTGKTIQNYPCFIGSSWLYFKVYFLGYKFVNL